MWDMRSTHAPPLSGMSSNAISASGSRTCASTSMGQLRQCGNAAVGRLRGGGAAHLGAWPRIPQRSGRLGGRLLPYRRLRVHLRPLRLWLILLLHGLHLGLSLGTHAKGGISGEGRVVHTWQVGLARLGAPVLLRIPKSPKDKHKSSTKPTLQLQLRPSAADRV